MNGNQIEESREDDLDAAFVEMTASIEGPQEEENIYNYSHDEMQ
jgi:hypothetical protein